MQRTVHGSGPLARHLRPCTVRVEPAAGTGRTNIETSSDMTTIRVKENEPFDVALRRFKRTIEKLGLLSELRAREFYENPTSERKR